MPFFPPVVALQIAASRPHLTAERTKAKITLDGRLDEAAWKSAPEVDAFTQKAPHAGQPPLYRTYVRVLYDDDDLWVGIRCEEPPKQIVARLTRRDRRVESDYVTVGLDSRRTGRSAFEFGVNAAGVLYDGVYFNDTEYSSDWDENWDAAVARTPEGWSAELRIPLRILRYDELPVQSWGLQVRRYVSALQETDEWAFIPRTAAGEVSRYGRLDGLVGLRAKRSLELRPFVAATLEHHDPTSATLARGFALGGSAGLDLKWHVSQALTLDATVNPDFGQVEADQVVLNLGTYETFYPEKRPFFLEGADIFNTPFQLVYTRRIGRAPGEPTLRTGAPFGERLVDEPKPGTIYAASKLTGELGHGFSGGELLALTAPSAIEVQTASGARLRRTIDPLTSFEVLRLKHPIGDNADLGVVATVTNRAEDAASYPAAPGAPGRVLCPTGETVPIGGRCFHDAYVGGVDGRWRSKSGEYAASAQVLGSAMNAGPPRTLPDGTVIRSGDVSPGGAITLAKEGGEHWVGQVHYDGHGRRLDYNDLGYMPRQNQHATSAFVEYRTLEPWWGTLETHTRLELDDRESLDGLSLGRGYAINTYWKLPSYWGLFAEVLYRPSYFDDREMGDGAALERAGLAGFEVAVNTDPRKRVYFEAWTQTALLTDGASFTADARLAAHVLPQLDLELLPQGLFSTGEPRYVTTRSGAYLFGRLRAESVGATLRATYTFAPRLTLQAYAQAFLATEHYSGFTSFPLFPAGARVVRIDALRPAAPPPDQPDYRDGTLNASIVLRWEYTLGSTLFVVYTHAQSGHVVPAENEPRGLDFKLIVPSVAADAVLLKLSYWLGT